MIQIAKEQEAFYRELKQIEKEMKSAAQQARKYDNSLNQMSRTIKNNEATIKQLQTMPGNRSIYVPIGQAFLKRGKNTTINQLIQTNNKLSESAKEIKEKFKIYSEQANKKYKVLIQGAQKLKKGKNDYQ